MLKSFEYISKLENILNNLVKLKKINDYHIKLNVNQQVDVFISSDYVQHLEELSSTVNEVSPNLDVIDFSLNSVLFEFLPTFGKKGRKRKRKSFLIKENSGVYPPLLQQTMVVFPTD